MSSYSRREFLGRGAALAGLAALGPAALEACGGSEEGVSRSYGDLVPDPGGVIDLPRGFQYRVLSEEGATLSSGVPVPGNQDGMAAFAGPGDTTVLVRNHELARGYEGREGQMVAGRNPFDRGELGGTTAVVLGPDRRKRRDYVTSSGTRANCAGGKTPWGTWLTSEEALTEGHGYVFEVIPGEPENDLSRTPIREMGSFSHEAVAIDPRTGIAYLTEDDVRGRIDPRDPRRDTVRSFLYRYLPGDRSRRPGALHRGGRLQALAVEERRAPDADLFEPRQRFGVVWKDVAAERAHDDALARGAARFTRLEGAAFAGGALWFADTEGGERRLGQIYRYLPERATLELFFESREPGAMNKPDNLVVSPWGDLWFVEDTPSVGDRVMGITPRGTVYEFARNRLNESELAGPCFAPDGRTFFVNLYSPGKTLAIWGPFRGQDGAARRRMAGAPTLAPSRSLGLT
jgi:uncharacterized protein